MENAPTEVNMENNTTFRTSSSDGSIFVTYSDDFRKEMDDVWGIELEKFLEKLLTRQKDFDKDRTGEHKFDVSGSTGTDGNLSITFSIVPKK